jgi:predicted SprT family Zn-dependent metalloprotease
MPKVKRTSENIYQYQCECGTEITFETDTPPKRLVKCFKCGKKESVDFPKFKKLKIEKEENEDKE